MNAALFLLAYCAAPAQGILPEMTVPQIEERALASRRRIRRGKVALEWAGLVHGKQRSNGPLTIWFDHDKSQFRADTTNLRTFRSKGQEQVKRARQVECRNCEKEGYQVSYDDVIFDDGGRMVLRLKPMKAGEKLPALDPRLLGFVPDNPSVLHHLNLETVFGRGDRKGQTVRQENLGGVLCYVVAFDVEREKGLTRYEYWAAPSSGYMLPRISITNTSQDRVSKGLVENELEQFGAVWYPRRSTYTSSTDGKVMTTVVARVASAEFDGPPDPTPFTLAGMGLREGVLVEVIDANGRSEPYTWKTQNLVTFVPKDLMAPAPQQPKARRWLFGVAGGLAALALGSLLLYWRRRRVAVT